MRAPLGEGPNVSNRAGNQESEWCSGSRGILGLRPGVGSAIRFLGRLTATRVRHGEGPTETGRAILVRTVPGSLSGRATPRVPSLSNSRSRCSQDLGVKVRRKKSYHVSTFQWAGPPPPPIHYLLRRPGGGQSTHTDRPVRRATGPMRIAAGLPHVAARPSPLLRPVPSVSNEGAKRVGLMPLLTSPRDPHPRPEPFIRPRDLNKGRAGPQGCGPEFEDLAPSLPSPPREHNPSCTPPERSGEEGRNRPLFPTKEQEIVGPSRWVCPGSDSLRKLSLEPEPHGQGSRAGLSRTGQSSAPVGGWMQ